MMAGLMQSSLCLEGISMDSVRNVANGKLGIMGSLNFFFLESF